MRAREWILTPTGALRAAPALLTSVLGIALALGLTIAYVARVDRAAEARNVERSRDWCRIIVMLDDRNQKLPPAQDRETADFRQALHDLRISKGC